MPTATDHLPKRPTRDGHIPRTSPALLTELPGSRPLDSLVAAAKRISGRKMKRTAPEKWQDESWDMYDEVGELRFVANTLAGAASRARIFAAKLPLGSDDPQPVDELGVEELGDAARAAAAAVRSIGGGTLGRAELVRRLIVQLFVPGDGFLVGLPPGVLDDRAPTESAPAPGAPDEGRAVRLDELTWHALSVNEVQVRGSKVSLNIGDQQPRELPQDDVMLVRVWRPHPRKWWAADSPVRANLPVLRELVGLTKHVGANIDSRLAGAGLLILGQSVEVLGAPAQAETPAEGDEQTDPFVSALIETMSTALEDRDSAASIVPLTIKVPDEAVEKVRHLSFSTPFDEHAKELRDEAIRRLALGLDAPPEVLLGLGGTNHWSAWQIEESTVKTHIEPLLSLVCDALTTEYLWPVLEEARVEGARDYVVWFETSELTLRPNRHGEAMALYNAGELSAAALRRESGFDESDAPDVPDVDQAVQTALAMVEQAPSLVAQPGLTELVRQIREVLGEGGDDEGGGVPAMGEQPEPADSGVELPDTQGAPPDLEASASPLTVPTNGARRG